MRAPPMRLNSPRISNWRAPRAKAGSGIARRWKKGPSPPCTAVKETRQRSDTSRRYVYGIDRIAALLRWFETRENTNRNLHTQNAVALLKGTIPDDNPAYYFASFFGLLYVGSGSESSCGPAAGRSASSANFNPGRCCSHGDSGSAQHDFDADHDWTSHTDYDEGSGTGRADYDT